MNKVEQYYIDVKELTHQYLDELIKDLYEAFGFSKAFITNEYEGEGISVTQIAMSEIDAMYLPFDQTQLCNSYMQGSRDVEITEQEKEEICITFEQLMYNSYGFDWNILIEETTGGVKYTIHELDSKNLDL